MCGLDVDTPVIFDIPKIIKKLDEKIENKKIYAIIRKLEKQEE